MAACHCQPMNRHASRMYSFSELTLIAFVCQRRQVPQLLRDQEIRICCKHRVLNMLEVRFELNFTLMDIVASSRVDTEDCCLLVCVFLLDVSWFVSV
jgi:hypothetical protein